MVHTKNTARKQHLGLPKARFPVVLPVTQKGTYTIACSFNSPINNADWTSLTPTLTGTKSPEVDRAVDRINEEHANSPLPNHQ